MTDQVLIVTARCDSPLGHLTLSASVPAHHPDPPHELERSLAEGYVRDVSRQPLYAAMGEWSLLGWFRSVMTEPLTAKKK